MTATPTTATPRRAAPPAVLLALLLGLLLGPVLGSGAGAAAAPSDGWVRLAHLSPDTPPVDVYLTSFRGRATDVVLPGVSYGTVSPYQRVAAGTYAVAMRAPGSAADSPPLLRTTVTVDGGRAYTVAGVGPNASLALRVLGDDLSRPSRGEGRVRVVQASAIAPRVDVTASSGDAPVAPIATGAAFPSTTAYADVPARSWTVRVQPRTGDARPVQRRVEVGAGTVSSLVVLDAPDGTLRLVVLTDAAGPDTVPSGAVAAGLGGGTAAGSTGPADRTGALGVLAASLALAAAGGVALVRGAAAARASREGATGAQ